MMKFNYLSNKMFVNGKLFKFDWPYIAAQLSLDMCSWKPTHQRKAKLFGKPVSIYMIGPIPTCRKVIGPQGDSIVSHAMVLDCGECEKCRIPFPFTRN